MQIITWNVNGLRAVAQKGFADWFIKTSPDLIALQEIKCTFEDVKGLLALWEPYYEVHLHPAQRKGYSGVALMVKKMSQQKPSTIDIGLGLDHFDSEGRFIKAEYENFIVLNGYFPNGGRDHSRVEYKLEFSREVLNFALKLKQKTKKGIIICGDINTAHQEIDLANPKANSKTTGFLPIERVFIDEMIQSGFIDIFRYHNPDLKGAYTWWTYRGDCRERNIGWRLDSFFCDKDFIKYIKNVRHHPEVVMSDHCPVEIVI